MAKNTHGIGISKVVGEFLSDAQTLPNAGTVDSTNMVNIAGATGGRLYLSVFANTATEIVTGQAFSIELQGFTSDTAASATGIHSSAGVVEPAHYYILHKTSADDQIAWLEGELIAEIPLPEKMLKALSYDWVQLVYLTDADESADKVDAFIHYR